MDQHKKSPVRRKPSFSVPEEVLSSSQAGWVYRTEPQPAVAVTAAPPQSQSRTPDSGLVDATAGALAAGMAAVSIAFLLGLRVASLPFGLGLRFFRAVAGN